MTKKSLGKKQASTLPKTTEPSILWGRVYIYREREREHLSIHRIFTFISVFTHDIKMKHRPPSLIYINKYNKELQEKHIHTHLPFLPTFFFLHPSLNFLANSHHHLSFFLFHFFFLAKHSNYTYITQVIFYTLQFG
jgi:hypothetical protein